MKPNKLFDTNKKPTQGIVVDGSCNNTKFINCQYQIVDLKSNELLFLSPNYAKGTCNVAEFLGVVKALQIRTDKSTPIYTDSLIAIKWTLIVRRCLTTFNFEKSCPEIHQEIIEANEYLQKHSPKNVIFWNNREWGENPADFGRKGNIIKDNLKHAK